jgi:hypothetical protein
MILIGTYISQCILKITLEEIRSNKYEKAVADVFMERLRRLGNECG